MAVSGGTKLRTVVGWVASLLFGLFGFLLFIFAPKAGWRWAAPIWGRVIMRLLNVRAVCEHDLKGLGPAIFVSNHQSLLDFVLLITLLPSSTKWVAKKELLWVPLWGWAFARGGAIFIDRKRGRAALETMKEGVRTLPSGWSIIVFPEGTRSRGPEIRHFKKGALHLAQASGLPVVPIGLDGASELAPHDSVWVRSGVVHVAVGDALHVGLGEGDLENARAEVQRRVQALVHLSHQKRQQDHNP